MRFIDTFNYHRNHSDVKLDDYIRNKRVALGIEVDAKIKLYLDTKYWVYLCDVHLGREKDPILIEIYHSLKDLCQSEKVICPISSNVLEEIIKQSDKTTLQASIELIDGFSKGISLISYYERLQAEILNFLSQYTKSPEKVFPLKHMVWTKLSYTLGTFMPYDTAFSESEELVVQKAFFDQLWNMSLKGKCNIIGYDSLRKFPSMPDIYKSINKDCQSHKHEVTSFTKVFMDEVCGGLDLMKPWIEKGLHYFFEKETGQKVSGNDYFNSELTNVIVGRIYEMFKSGKDNGNFPSLKINSGIHAAIRWDKRRNFEKNHSYDFGHAQAAIPYCEYFFTERGLKHLMSSNPLKYDIEFNCKLAATPKDVLTLIREISP